MKQTTGTGRTRLRAPSVASAARMVRSRSGEPAVMRAAPAPSRAGPRCAGSRARCCCRRGRGHRTSDRRAARPARARSRLPCAVRRSFQRVEFRLRHREAGMARAAAPCGGTLRLRPAASGSNTQEHGRPGADRSGTGRAGCCRAAGPGCRRRSAAPRRGRRRRAQSPARRRSVPSQPPRARGNAGSRPPGGSVPSPCIERLGCRETADVRVRRRARGRLRPASRRRFPPGLRQARARPRRHHPGHRPAGGGADLVERRALSRRAAYHDGDPGRADDTARPHHGRGGHARGLAAFHGGHACATIWATCAAPARATGTAAT